MRNPDRGGRTLQVPGRVDNWSGRVAVSALGAVVLLLGLPVLAQPAEGTAPPPLYAYALGTAKSPASCPATSVSAKQCTLAEALALAHAGGSVLLATSGKTDPYYGNFTVKASGTTAKLPVSIDPASGVAAPTINGDSSNKVLCPTASCEGSVLTVGAGVYADLRSVTITGGDDDEVHGGGGVDDLGSLTMTGDTISGCTGQVGGGVAVGKGANLVVKSSHFANDSATYFGGAIDSGSVIGHTTGAGTVTVTKSTFTGDKAPRGGAIDNGDGGTGVLTVTDSDFASDTSSNHGGAVDTGDAGSGTATVKSSTFSGDSSTNGGALDNGDAAGKGTLTVTGSTFSDDSATDGGAIDNGDGGTGTVTIRDSTFTGDKGETAGSVVDSGDAAGTASAAILDSTLDANLGEPDIDSESGAFYVAGSILAGTEANCLGSVTDDGYNLISNASSGCGFGANSSDLVGANPELGPLAANGGPTKTMEPSATSPVLEQIPNPAVASVSASKTTSFCPLADQAGSIKNEAYGCAIGSVDPANTVPVVTSLGSTMGPAAGGTAI
ncbi:MAG TPA: choice-of-anchor Q domain-containing protein, partial [Acidimicrobiales bacterium]|nr:choice-of-anchor Q domain-containing protein [Acidimicrobiales bacterium]